MNIINCIDEKYKDKLLSKGFKLINTSNIDGKKYWILLPSDKFNFESIDKKKCFVNNKMIF